MNSCAETGAILFSDREPAPCDPVLSVMVNALASTTRGLTLSTVTTKGNLDPPTSRLVLYSNPAVAETSAPLTLGDTNLFQTKRQRKLIAKNNKGRKREQNQGQTVGYHHE